MRCSVACRVLIFASLGACRPEIGDDCLSSIDCSQAGDRLCDTSQPDGYCTVFNCEPDKCPTEASCLGFGLTLDPVCSADEDPRWPRFERTFCLRACDSNEDCRAGYECVEPSERSAASIDLVSENRARKACFSSATAVATQTSDFEACRPSSAVATIAVGVGSSTSAGGGGGSSSSIATTTQTSSSAVSSTSGGGAGGG